MGTDQNATVTNTGTEKTAVIFTDVDVVKLHLGLKLLNGSISELEKANMLTKATKAENVLRDARDLMAQTVFTLHATVNEIERVKAELFRIGQIGVIKNG